MIRTRILVALLAAIMCLSLAACGDPASPATATSAAPAATSAAASAAATTAGQETEPEPGVDISEKVNIKMAAFVGPIDGVFGALTDPVTLFLNEKFNIEIDVIDAGENSGWGTMLNAAMATDDLPDIFLIPSMSQQLPLLIEANKLLTLDDYYARAELAPFMSTDPLYQASIMMHRNTATQYTDTGLVYTFGMCRGMSGSGINPLVGNAIRWDLYKEMGYPEMNTVDDLLNVLKDMQEMFPTNDQGQKAYAIGAWFGEGQGWGDWLMTSNMWTTGNFNASSDKTLNFNRGTGMVNEINGLIDPDGMFWDQIDFFYKANQMGILDPESFTQKNDQYTEKCEAGRYYWLGAGWHPNQFQQKYNEQGRPEIGFAYIPLNGEGTNRQIDNNYVGGERNYGVASKVKNPERIIMFIDFMQSYEGSTIALNGIEGVYWEYDAAGIPTPKEARYDGSQTNDEMKAASGLGVYHHFMGNFNGMRHIDTGIPMDLTFMPYAIEAKLSIVQKDQMAHAGVTDLAAYYAAGTQSPKLPSYSLGLLPDELRTYADNLVTYNFTEAFKIILAKDDAEYQQLRDAYIAGLDQYKADEIFQYWKERAAIESELVKSANELYYQHFYVAK